MEIDRRNRNLVEIKRKCFKELTSGVGKLVALYASRGWASANIVEYAKASSQNHLTPPGLRKLIRDAKSRREVVVSGLP